MSLTCLFSTFTGLGTSTSKEAKEYFSDMDRHKIPFKYTGAEDDAAINLVLYTLHCFPSTIASFVLVFFLCSEFSLM
mgnify:CR=1 FL=1